MPAIMHGYGDRGDDFYPTPRAAVDAFISIERNYLPKRIWEPACGDGAIVLPLREAGYDVSASDLVDRGCPDGFPGIDFLLPFQKQMKDYEAIVTNPPYKLATQFVTQACAIAPYVAMLLRLQFLEGIERRLMFEAGTLARVHISSRRLPMMHRHGWDGPKSTSTTAFAWFVWDRKHRGEPIIRWFDWKESGHGLLNRSAMAG